MKKSESSNPSPVVFESYSCKYSYSDWLARIEYEYEYRFAEYEHEEEKR